MSRVPRRRSHRRWPRLLPVGAGALVVALAWGVSVAHAEAPTVTFRGGPLAPALCPAAPDTPDLAIDDGTWVNIVNRTGAKATLEVDGTPGQTIPKDGGLSVMLPPGRHDVRLIPHCAVHGTLLPVVIDVSMLQSLPSPSASAVASPPAQPPPSGAPESVRYPPVTVPPPSGSGPGGPGDGGVSGPADGPPAGDSSGPAGGPFDQGHDPDLLVVPYAVPEGEDPRGTNLLAVIATICVSGVTVAIIRAILAQRTTRMVRL
jgi:hypothetical protein